MTHNVLSGTLSLYTNYVVRRLLHFFQTSDFIVINLRHLFWAHIGAINANLGAMFSDTLSSVSKYYFQLCSISH